MHPLRFLISLSFNQSDIVCSAVTSFVCRNTIKLALSSSLGQSGSTKRSDQPESNRFYKAIRSTNKQSEVQSDQISQQMIGHTRRSDQPASNRIYKAIRPASKQSDLQEKHFLSLLTSSHNKKMTMDINNNTGHIN